MCVPLFRCSACCWFSVVSVLVVSKSAICTKDGPDSSVRTYKGITYRDVEISKEKEKLIASFMNEFMKAVPGAFQNEPNTKLQQALEKLEREFVVFSRNQGFSDVKLKEEDKRYIFEVQKMANKEVPIYILALEAYINRTIKYIPEVQPLSEEMQQEMEGFDNDCWFVDRFLVETWVTRGMVSDKEKSLKKLRIFGYREIVLGQEIDYVSAMEIEDQVKTRIMKNLYEQHKNLQAHIKYERLKWCARITRRKRKEKQLKKEDQEREKMHTASA